MALTPPSAPRQPQSREHHGDLFIDNFEWMRRKDDPALLAYLEAENAYTDQQTEPLARLRTTLFEEIKGHTQETDLSVPVREGQWWYYSRTVEGQQYAIHCRAPISGPDDWTPPVVAETGSGSGVPGEQVVLDDNVEAAPSDFYSLGSFDVSTDGTALLFATDTVGDERYTIRLRDLAGDDTYNDVIPNTSSGALFDPSGRFIFYTTVDDSWRPDTVWRHRVGTPASDDVAIHHEPDESFWVGIGLTRSRRFLVIEAGSSVTSEARILDSADPEGEFRIVWPRKEGVEYSLEHAVIAGEDRLLLVHNDGAEDFMVVDVPVAEPQASVFGWRFRQPRVDATDAAPAILQFCDTFDGDRLQRGFWRAAGAQAAAGARLRGIPLHPATPVGRRRRRNQGANLTRLSHRPSRRR
jgi:oligopeptidase B